MNPQNPGMVPFDILKMLSANSTPPIPPPMGQPAAPPPNVSPLAGLAAASGRTNPNVSKVSISGPAEGSIVWTQDRSHWREKNSPNWQPANTYSPAVEKKTTKVVK